MLGRRTSWQIVNGFDATTRRVYGRQSMLTSLNGWNLYPNVLIGAPVSKEQQQPRYGLLKGMQSTNYGSSE